MTARACVLSPNDVDELGAALREQRDGLCRLLVEVDATRNGMTINEQELLDAVGTLATLNKMIGQVIDLAVRNGSNGRSEP